MLEKYMETATRTGERTYSLIMSKFLIGAKECDFDGVANHGHIMLSAFSEHVE